MQIESKNQQRCCQIESSACVWGMTIHPLVDRADLHNICIVACLFPSGSIRELRLSCAAFEGLSSYI